MIKRLGLEVQSLAADRRMRPGSLAHHRLWPPACLAVLSLVLIAGIVVLFVNTPAGFSRGLGQARGAVAFFRGLWSYPSLALSAHLYTPLVVSVLTALWCAYLVQLLLLERAEARIGGHALMPLVVASAALSTLLLLFFMPPLLSADVYNYSLYGRMTALHGLNPYMLPPSAALGDALLPLSAWPGETTRYGPVWTLLSAGIAALARENGLATLLGFKTLAALSHCANATLVLLLARHFAPGREMTALFLYACNPLILIETVGSAHNDSVMLTLALLGLWLAVRGHRLGGMALLMTSVLVKYVTLLLLGFYLISWLAGEPTWSRRCIVAVKAGATMAAVLIAGYLPFWAGPASPGRFLFGWTPGLNSTPDPVLYYASHWLDGVVAARLGLAQRAGLLYAILQVAFLALIFFLCLKLWRERGAWGRVIEYWVISNLVFVTLVYAGLYPWYLVIPLAAPAIMPPSRLRNRLFATTCALAIIFMSLYAILIPFKGA